MSCFCYNKYVLFLRFCFLSEAKLWIETSQHPCGRQNRSTYIYVPVSCHQKLILHTVRLFTTFLLERTRAVKRLEQATYKTVHTSAARSNFQVGRRLFMPC